MTLLLRLSRFATPSSEARVAIWLLLLLCTPLLGEAQIIQTTFGKNRVQFSRQIDEWMLYETPNFVTYWYGDARNVAQASLQIAELDFVGIQTLLEHQMTEKIEILVFSDLSDVKQSNIGQEQLLASRNVGTTPSIVDQRKFQWNGHTSTVGAARPEAGYEQVGNKIFVHFNGNHRHLQAQIREGMAAVVLNSMLYGGNLQEIVQNSVLLNLPGWYTQGLTAFCGEAWNPELDNQMRELTLSNRYTNFTKLAKDHPRMAGHAFWYYISLHFGKSTISNLLYLTRINRNLDAGLLYVLGGAYRRTTDAMMEYYRTRYREEQPYVKAPEGKGEITLKNKRNLPLRHFKISPDGRRIAWVSNQQGRWKVWMRETGKKGKPQLLLKGGTRNPLEVTDYNYPLLAWNPDNRRIAVVFERRDVIHLAQIPVGKATAKSKKSKKDDKKEIKPVSPEYQRIFSIDYINSTDLAMSAAVKGFSDLFIYRTVTRQSERLTQDHWDDLDASVVTLNGQKHLLFASNRITDTLSLEKLDTILPLQHFDLFAFNLDERSPELTQITETPWYDERNPVAVDSTHYMFLSDQSGIANRHTGYLEPYIAYHKATLYFNNQTEASALDVKKGGEWPLEKTLKVYAPLDSVLFYKDSTLTVDSIRSAPVWKKRAITSALTNYDRNIGEQHSTARAGRLLETVRREGRQRIFVRDNPALPTAGTETKPSPVMPATRYRELALRAAGLPVPPRDTQVLQTNKRIAVDTSDRRQPDSLIPIQPGWRFQMPEHLNQAAPRQETPQPPTDTPPETNALSGLDSLLLPPSSAAFPARPALEIAENGSILRFNPARIVPYRLKFRTDFISTNVDNNLLFEGLDSYAGTPDGFQTPPPGIMLRANFKDLLENYALEAGFRMPTTFNGAEYYVWLDSKKYRIDRRMALYRKTITNTIGTTRNGNPISQRNNTVLGQYELRYPFSPFFSIRALGAIRQDRSLILSSERSTLEQPDSLQQRASIRLSAVFDNSVDIDMNVKTGTRAKLFVEVVKRFEFGPQNEWKPRFNTGFMTVIGFDARHYLPLDRRSILALRLAGASTFGSERILYVLGGVDNWVFPQFNENIPLPSAPEAGGAFAFQTLAAHLRGFKQNIRNGSSFGLFNAELRVPIMKYFSRRPVMGNFWRNFQLIGFFDTGTAWQGPNPFKGANPINSVVIANDGSPISVKVNYFRDPLVAGYGVGLRALLFGMFLRVDYGWGIETRKVQKPQLHLALGTDF